MIAYKGEARPLPDPSLIRPHEHKETTMSKPQTEAERKAKLDDTMRRFEERMATTEEKKRPKRSRRDVLDAAIDAVQTQLGKERAAMDQQFRMASQQLAQKETVEGLEWLVVDLKRIRDEEG
jgi:septal ring factor EnvC (AmiA/AmiB activator)